MYALQLGGIELPVFSRGEAERMVGSDSGFPTTEERRARRAERLADIRFRLEKGYPVTMLERWLLRRG